METSVKDPVKFLFPKHPISVGENVTLRSAAAVMHSENIGAVLVQRQSGEMGMLSERDIIAALAEGADPDLVYASDVMTWELVMASPDDSVLDVAQLMIDEHLRHVAVGKGQHVNGVVSARDMLSALTGTRMSCCE